MRDHDHCQPVMDGLDCLDELALGIKIEGACSLVEYQKRWLVIEGPRDANSLALTARESHTALARNRVEAFGQRADECGQLGDFDALQYLRLRDFLIGDAKGDVAADCVVD